MNYGIRVCIMFGAYRLCKALNNKRANIYCDALNNVLSKVVKSEIVIVMVGEMM